MQMWKVLSHVLSTSSLMWLHDCIYKPCSVKFTPCRNKLRPRLRATSVSMHTYTGSFCHAFQSGWVEDITVYERVFLAIFILVVLSVLVYQHSSNCFCPCTWRQYYIIWLPLLLLQISEFNVSGNPVFRDRSIQGESVGPEIPLRPSLPNFTLLQKKSQGFTSM
jgi:hypothetical protein